ncbi:hypothetical protein ACOSQ3_010056 [Xanthoceras sorbifolium]
MPTYPTRELDFLPSSSVPSLFLGGLRSVLVWAVFVLLVLAPIGSSPRHLHGDRWDRVFPSRFSFDPLSVRVGGGGVIGFAVAFYLCSGRFVKGSALSWDAASRFVKGSALSWDAAVK